MNSTGEHPNSDDPTDGDATIGNDLADELSLSEQALPREGRIVGIDYGTVRIGVAITDRDQMLASPYENYNVRGRESDAGYFGELAKQERVAFFVVGLPVHLSGDESQKSLEARAFGKWLSEVTNCPVTYFDERYTSKHAEDLLMGANLTKKKRKQRLDMLAAQLMLTAYLDSDRNAAPPGAL